jgi:alpha-L-fucosidase
MLQENIAIGQRIENLTLEYWNGKHWKNIIEGTTVGYKRLWQFPEVTTDKVRLKIISSRLNPTISEIGLYFQANQ